MSTSERFEQYEVLRREGGGLWELGRGAMGVTYKAFDTDLHCEVALKVINPNILGNEEVGQRFLREARSLARLRHPNIATVYRLGKSAGGSYFYAMEFCEGETLEQRVQRAGPLDAEQTLEIALQVSKALILAEEQHLVHRDIKPANLILTERRDEGVVVKVIDFGLAKIYGDLEGANQSAWASLSMAGFIGTAHFASPEQLEEKELDSRADIYSLGATLWYGLTGKSLFSGSLAQIMSQHLSVRPPVEELPSYVPGPLRNLLAHMLEKDREQRPADGSELKREILECKERLQRGADAIEGTRASFTLLELLRARQGLNLSEVLRLLEPLAKQVDEAEGKKTRLELAKHEIKVELVGSGANVAELLNRPVGEWPRFKVMTKPAGVGESNLADQTLLSMATIVPSGRIGIGKGDQKQELGMLVYELLGGVPPRVGSSSGYVPLPRLTSEGNAVLQRAVSSRPDQQFPTAKALFDSLSSTAGYEPAFSSKKAARQAVESKPKSPSMTALRFSLMCGAALVVALTVWAVVRKEYVAAPPATSAAAPLSPTVTPIPASMPQRPIVPQPTAAPSISAVAAGQSVAEGYTIPPITVSPDKQYGVTVPSMALLEAGHAHNQLVAIGTGRVLATINAETYGEDRNRHMNHATLNPKWSADGSMLAWVVEGKWSPRAFVLLKLNNGSVEKQVDVIPAIQSEILTKAKTAAPQKYDFVKAKNAGAGSAFPDGFVVNIDTPPERFSLPFSCRVNLDSDPKGMAAPAEQLRAIMTATIGVDGSLNCSDIQILNEEGSTTQPETPTWPAKINECVRHFVQVNQSSDVNATLACYSELVDYFDEGIKTKSYIRTDLQKYGERWPVRQDNIPGNIEVQEIKPDSQYAAGFSWAFYVQSPARGEWIRGIFRMTLDFTIVDNEPKISAIKEKVLHREKGKLSGSQQPNMGPISAAGSWVGVVHPTASSSGQQGQFNVRLEIDEAAHSAQMWIGDDSRVTHLAIISQRGKFVQLRGRVPPEVGPATMTVNMNIVSGLAYTTFRTQADNGGWANIEGTLSKQ